MGTGSAARSWRIERIGVAAIVASTSIARADPPVASREQPARRVPAEPEPEPDLQRSEHTAASVSGTPQPGHEDNRTDAPAGDSTGRVIARGVLFVPKLLFELGMLPLRGGFYAYDRYELDRRYYDTFYNHDRTIGLVPTATYETGLGFTAGVRFVDEDLIGRHEKLVVQATVGTAYRVGLLASVDSGDRLGPVRIELGGNFERRPAEPFYGIGDAPGQPIEDPGSPSNINALTNPTAVRTFTRYQEARALMHADWWIIPGLRAGALGSITDLSYDPSTQAPSVQTVYNPMSLVGFDTGVQHLYGELGLAWDTRHRVSVWEPLTVHGAGSLAIGFAGRVHRIEGGGSDFWRYGVELQHYFHIGYGPRVIITRFHGEAVTGPLDAVPFTELPMLGGDSFLRGYPYARFRDRLAAVASLQYMWNLSQYAEAFVFVDTGRVYPSYDDLTLHGVRVGYGLGFEFQGLRSFLFDATIASSSDGGIVFTAAFSPVLDARARWR